MPTVSEAQAPAGAPAIGGTFPSPTHHAHLRQSARSRRLADDELWHWHAYDYGWRRVMLGDTRQTSPIDPQGSWWDAPLVARATAFWRSRDDR